MSVRTPARLRIGAIVLLVALAVQPVAVARKAWAGDTAPGGGGAAGTISQINKAFGLLFMLFKLAEFLGTLELPAQGGPADPQWGSHPGPLPVVSPPCDQPEAPSPPIRALAPA